MPQFVMPLDNQEQINAFEALDEFTQGYVEAIFFTDCTPDTPELESMTFGDLSPHALSDIVKDCTDFQRMATELTLAYERDGYSAKRAGVDFWLTRCGHGAGFWDRKELEADCLGDQLSEHARRFRNRDIYAGDDGRMYLS